MKKSARFDIGELVAPERRADGTIRSDARLTRTGVFLYRRTDGTVIREYRPPEEVFNEDSLRSLHMVPVTMNHPGESVTARNARNYSVGSVGQDIRRDSEFVRGTITVNDSESIGAMSAGKNQLSCGYMCQVFDEPGLTPDGEEYDTVQRNIVYDHVAIVDRGRAGDEVKARVDAYEHAGVDTAVQQMNIEEKSDTIQETLPTKERLGDNKMKFTFKVDGVEYALEGDESAKQALAKYQDSADKSIKDLADKAKKSNENLVAEKSALEAKADAAQSELDKEKAARAKDKEGFSAAVRARVALEREASSVMDSVDVSGTDDEIRLAVAAKANPDFDLSKKDSAYIAALYDIAVSSAAKVAKDAEDAVEDVRSLAGDAENASTGEEEKADDAQKEYNTRMDEMSRKPVGAYLDPVTNSLKVS